MTIERDFKGLHQFAWADSSSLDLRIISDVHKFTYLAFMLSIHGIEGMTINILVPTLVSTVAPISNGVRHKG